MTQTSQKVLSKKLGALKISKIHGLDHADRGHYDAVVPVVGKLKKLASDDEAQIVSVEPKRRSSKDAHAFTGRRAVVVVRNKIVGVLG